MGDLLIKQNSIAQSLEVGQILRAAHGTLVSNERVFTEDKNRKAVEFGRHARGKSLVGFHAADTCEQIDAIGRPAELNHISRLREIGSGKIDIGKTEFADECDNLLRVFRGGTDENVEIACITRPPVKGETVRADYYVINAA